MKKKIIVTGIVVVIFACMIAVALMMLGQKKNDPNSPSEIVMAAFLEEFYVKDEVGGTIKGEDFWQTAEIFEIFVDAYERTGDEKYKTLMQDTFDGFVAVNLNDWSWNDFNDDITWMVIGCARAHQLTGESQYLEIAEKNFNVMFDRAWSDDLGGGLFWRTENTTKNSCINCPSTIAAALLYQITNKPEYLEKAEQIYGWQEKNLFSSETGAVYDAYDMSGKINEWASTYNQGTFIGASSLLYQITKSERYLNNAKLAADYTVHTMYNGEVMNNEDEGKDLPGFKGILARWLYRFSVDCDQHQYDEWMCQNAEAAFANRNAKNIMWTKFAEKTPEEPGGAWGCSAGVSMLVNCPKE